MKRPTSTSSSKDAWWSFKDDRYRLAAFVVHELRVGAVWIAWITVAGASGVTWHFVSKMLE